MERNHVDIILHEFSGRMSRAIIDAASETEWAGVVGYLVLPGRPKPKADELAEGRVDDDVAEGPTLRRPPEPRSPQTVVVDFTGPAGMQALLGAMAGTGYPLVSGTTGIGGQERELLEAYSKESAVFYDENMSYGISVVKRLLREARGLVGPGADVEIVEFHHRNKADFPSGTALALARAARPDTEIVAGRASQAGPDESRTHIHSVRSGAIPGDHEVHFGLPDETLTLTHRALSRNVFARGALLAARFVADRSPGLYSMDDLVENASNA